MEKAFVCIQCPNGCRLTARVRDDGSVAVSGNGCNRGAAFAEQEMTCPMRSLTTTVRTVFPALPWLPVRTDGEVKKADIPAVMRAARGVTVTELRRMGDVVLPNAAGTGRNLIATCDME